MNISQNLKTSSKEYYSACKEYYNEIQKTKLHSLSGIVEKYMYLANDISPTKTSKHDVIIAESKKRKEELLEYFYTCIPITKENKSESGFNKSFYSFCNNIRNSDSGFVNEEEDDTNLISIPLKDVKEEDCIPINQIDTWSKMLRHCSKPKSCEMGSSSEMNTRKKHKLTLEMERKLNTRKYSKFQSKSTIKLLQSNWKENKEYLSVIDKMSERHEFYSNPKDKMTTEIVINESDDDSNVRKIMKSKIKEKDDSKNKKKTGAKIHKKGGTKIEENESEIKKKSKSNIRENGESAMEKQDETKIQKNGKSRMRVNKNESCMRNKFESKAELEREQKCQSVLEKKDNPIRKRNAAKLETKDKSVIEKNGEAKIEIVGKSKIRKDGVSKVGKDKAKNESCMRNKFESKAELEREQKCQSVLEKKDNPIRKRNAAKLETKDKSVIEKNGEAKIEVVGKSKIQKDGVSKVGKDKADVRKRGELGVMTRSRHKAMLDEKDKSETDKTAELKTHKHKSRRKWDTKMNESILQKNVKSPFKTIAEEKLQDVHNSSFFIKCIPERYRACSDKNLVLMEDLSIHIISNLENVHSNIIYIKPITIGKDDKSASNLPTTTNINSRSEHNTTTTAATNTSLSLKSGINLISSAPFQSLVPLHSTTKQKSEFVNDSTVMTKSVFSKTMNYSKKHDCILNKRSFEQTLIPPLEKKYQMNDDKMNHSLNSPMLRELCIKLKKLSPGKCSSYKASIEKKNMAQIYAINSTSKKDYQSGPLSSQPSFDSKHTLFPSYKPENSMNKSTIKKCRNLKAILSQSPIDKCQNKDLQSSLKALIPNTSSNDHLKEPLSSNSGTWCYPSVNGSLQLSQTEPNLYEPRRKILKVQNDSLFSSKCVSDKQLSLESNYGIFKENTKINFDADYQSILNDEDSHDVSYMICNTYSGFKKTKINFSKELYENETVETKDASEEVVVCSERSSNSLFRHHLNGISNSILNTSTFCSSLKIPSDIGKTLVSSSSSQNTSVTPSLLPSQRLQRLLSNSRKR